MLVDRLPILNPASLMYDDDDRVESLLTLVPDWFVSRLREHPQFDQLMEVSMDVGRKPIAYFHSTSRVEEGQLVIQEEDIQRADDLLGKKLSSKSRVVIDGTLHRIGKMINADGRVIGMTLRVGRSRHGHVTLLDDVINSGKSLLLLGKPGVGKTTMIRGIARALSESGKRVVIVDSCNEIAGNSDVPHHSIGKARRVQIPTGKKQSDVMIEVVENHTPEVMIIDEISNAQEVSHCKTIAERGIQLISTAHGTTFLNIIRNPVLNKLAGGIQSVILSGKEILQKNMKHRTVQERCGSPTFPIIVELRDPKTCIVHWTKHSMDLLLRGAPLNVQLRKDVRGMKTVQCREYNSILSEYTSLSASDASCIKDLVAMNGENVTSDEEPPRKMRRIAPTKTPTKTPTKAPTKAPTTPYDVRRLSQEELLDFMRRNAPGKEHLNLEHPYGCSLCSIFTKTLESLCLHAIGRKHNDQLQESTPRGACRPPSTPMDSKSLSEEDMVDYMMYDAPGKSHLHLEDPFRCSLCSITTTSLRLLYLHATGKKHKKQVDGTPSVTRRPPSTPMDSKSLSEEDMVDYMRYDAPGKRHLHLEDPFRCSLCSITTTSLRHLYLHATGKKHKEQVDGTPSVTRRLSSPPMDSKSLSEDDMVDYLMYDAPGRNQLHLEYPFRCDLCSITTPSVDYLYRHVIGNKHKTQVSRKSSGCKSPSPPMDFEIYSEEDMIDYLRYHAPGRKHLSIEYPYGCKLCSISTPSLEYLYRHAIGKKHASQHEEELESMKMICRRESID